MGETTGIAWTEATWNPWMGCSKVSPGCAHCYMFREQERYGQDPEVVRRSKTKFNDPLKWKEPTLCFTCSWSDWFHEDADAWRAEAWAIVKATPHITYQILTKRPQNIAGRLPADWGSGYPNVWLGVSVENQRFAEERIPLLADIPAAVRFASYEPALGPVNWHHPYGDRHCADCFSSIRNRDCPGCLDAMDVLDWVIVGGESGPGARPFDLAWARSTIAACKTAGTACFVKQLGRVPIFESENEDLERHHYPLPLRDPKGSDPSEWPSGLRVQEWPK
jgi:protein gp37